MLRIIQSNDMEVLVQHLLRDADQHPPQGVSPEQFIVPTLGFGRWLKSRIAARRGIAANIQTPYAAQWVWQQFARVLPGVGARSPFDTARMRLRLYAELQKLPDDADHAQLKRWLEHQQPVQTLALATTLAMLFQSYLVYRPDWLASWGEGRRRNLGPDEAWQMRLWRALLATEPLSGPGHPAEAYFDRLATAQRDGTLATLLPARVGLIGIASLPPLYLDIFHRLSRFTEVTFWWLNPCRSFWVDLVPAKLQAELAEHSTLTLPAIGHELLAAWGQQPRAQLARFLALEGLEGVTDARAFIAPEGGQQLARLQRSLLDLAPLPMTAANAQDDSITLHDCHSLTRQLEVLHDALLHRFAADPTLRPADVLVLLPDLDAAAATIDAVWGALPADRALPYAISGATLAREAPLTRALSAALALLQSRFAAPDLLGLLQQPAVSARFGLQAEDLTVLERWLAEAGTHWGSDAAHLATLELPGAASHTWAAALERLLLGSVQPLQGLGLSGDVRPVDAVAGRQSERLGQLLLALRTLETARQWAAQARPLRDWCRWLTDWLGQLLLPAAENLAEELSLRAAIAALAADAGQTRLAQPLPLAVFATLLDDTLRGRAPGGVATGRVTFTTLQALRGVPSRVICVLGLDDGSLPRQPLATEFDLLRQSPRAGDRDLRNEDRGAFLDALLAARDAFWLGTNGRSARDNAALPPAVVVSELVDALALATPGGHSAWLAAHRHQHALQGFSPRYFDGQTPRSFAADQLPAARMLAGGREQRVPARPLLAAALPEAGPEWRRVSLTAFLRFWRHPVRALLRDRLGIALPSADEALSADEPFALARPWTLDDEALRLHAAGLPAETLARVLAADVRLPQGAPGRALAEQRLAALAPLAQRFAGLRGTEPPWNLPFSLRFDHPEGPLMLEGTLADVTSAGLLALAPGPRQWFQVLPLRLQHLVLCAVAPEGVDGRAQLLTQEGLTTWHPLADAREQLQALLEHYWQGLHAPHPFCPKSAYAWRAATADKALAAAELAWRGDGFNKAGENEDVWYRLLHGGIREALPAGFATAATLVYGAAPLPEPVP